MSLVIFQGNYVYRKETLLTVWCPIGKRWINSPTQTYKPYNGGKEYHLRYLRLLRSGFALNLGFSIVPKHTLTCWLHGFNHHSSSWSSSLATVVTWKKFNSRSPLINLRDLLKDFQKWNGNNIPEPYQYFCPLLEHGPAPFGPGHRDLPNPAASQHTHPESEEPPWNPWQPCTNLPRPLQLWTEDVRWWETFKLLKDFWAQTQYFLNS